MCGIVGYIGENQAVPVLLNGLSKLEYRGYDSAGISVYHDGIHTIKVKGKLAGLREKVEKDDKKSSHIGIGHTRWATHGVPNEINSHPHNSQNGKISVVHNGIIENYLELKNMLIEKGYTFKSETDTEVVAQLFEDLYDGDMVSTTRKLLEKIRGAYALGIMCTDHPDTLVAVRKDCPLLQAAAGLHCRGRIAAAVDLLLEGSGGDYDVGAVDHDVLVIVVAGGTADHPAVVSCFWNLVFYM